MSSPHQPGARLERALELLLQSPPSTRADAERLLAENDDLRDLLEPMLEARTTDRDDDADQVLGDHRLVRELGRGGMGIVYEAWQRSLDRRVAVKVLAPGLASSASALARFRREAAAAGRLRHPHLVEVHGFGSDGGRHFIAMQFVDGVPLHDCRERFRAPAAVVGLLLQITDALAYAHAHGLVHRDVKPGNVLVQSDGHALLTDFGVAHDAALPSLTQTGGFVGTLDYASPEQVRGEPVDARTDVWALGVIAHELLTGEHPFQAPTRQALLHRILHHEPASLRGRPGIGEDLAAVVAQALAKSRDHRYRSAAALLADLHALQRGAAVSARLPTTSERLRRWMRREPWQATALGALLAGLVATSIGIVVAAERAEQNAALASAERQAKQELARSVDAYELLSGIMLHERAVQAEAAIYPAWPRQLGALEAWQRDHLAPLEQLAPRVDAELAALRAQAVPRTAAQRDADRRAHPRWPEFAATERDLGWQQRTNRTAEAPAVAAPPLPTNTAEASAAALNEEAWQRVAPKATERHLDDEAPLGLAFAEAAVARGVGTALHHQLLDTLAWALFANGRDQAAAAASAQALALAPAAEVDAYAGYQRELMAAIAERTAREQALSTRLQALDAELETGRSYTFATPARQFLHDTLTQLQGRLQRLRVEPRGRVETRLRWARQLHELTVAHPLATVSWDEARAAIARADDVVANAGYRGRPIALDDDAIIGLVPIGMNPVTKLWEFYDLASAWDGAVDPRTLSIPRLDADGSVDVDTGTGIVFVLLPGGTFAMGSQAGDPAAPNHDPDAINLTGPVQQVTLDPFLIARHELTKAQWARLCDGDADERWPSGYPAGFDGGPGFVITAVHPVERMSWNLADRVLRQHGWSLPTEAQWEYACRAGTSTAWWCGATSDQLAGCANVYDRSATMGALTVLVPEAFEDGYRAHAPVGSFRANPFGLFDMHGNVGEWCLDAPALNRFGFRAGDGARQRTEQPGDRTARGGSFEQQGRTARSSMWVYGPREQRAADLGVRPVRRLPRR
jgi:formylglycine-generating enzyme required for sulfatase activity